MNTKIIQIIIVIVAIASISYYLMNPNKETVNKAEQNSTNHVESEKPITQDKKADIKQPELNSVATTTETKPNDTPIVEGKKERPASLTQKDEIYTEELALEREKVTIADPIPVRPKQPFIKWVMQFSGSVAGAITAKDNKLHFGTYDYQVFTLNAESGEVVNTAKTVSQPINSTRMYKDLFLVPQRNGQVTAYSTLDGKEKWNHRIAVDKSKAEIDFSISGINVFGNKL